MISKLKAQMYCAEPIELIENYEEAVKDDKLWDCHHVWETMLGYSKQELIELNEYYGIPACNLIFLKHSEHARIHNQGKKAFWYGKHLSEETRKKMSESLKGEKHPMFGKHHCEDTKKKMSESHINNTKLSKPILQFTKDGVFIAEYPSIRECEKQTGINHSSIILVLKGKGKSASGYIFKYK